MNHPILEGTWAEVSRKAVSLRGDVHVRLEVIESTVPGVMIRKGMFPGLQGLTDADFANAEWRISAQK